MQRIAIAWAALSLGILASPSTAQRVGGTAEAQLESRYLQSVAPAPPPPRAHYVAPKPPPFPPMPRTAPKKRSAKAVTVHRSSPKRHETAKHSTSKRHETASKGRHAASKRKHEAVSAREAKVHLSPRTIRQCHGMGYRQIMAHRDCRALMQQEISAADQSRHAAKRHKAAAKAKASAKGRAAAKSKTKRQTARKRGRR